MKKLISCLVILAVGMFTIGCGGDTATKPKDGGTKPVEKPKTDDK